MRQFSAEYLRTTRRGMWADSREALSPLQLERRNQILDVGCGEGALTRVLAAESPGRVVGCDRDASLLTECAGPTVQADAYDLPFRPNSSDLVVCQALLINLTHPGRAVEEFTRVAETTVACIEPDNSAVTVTSTVDDERQLAGKARDRYLAGVETDVTLGADAAGLLRDAGLSDVTTTRYDQTHVIEPPYSDHTIRAMYRKASADGLRQRRSTMTGSDEELDTLRNDWRAMGRRVIDQLQAGEYRRREIVPFYVVVGAL